MTNAPKIIIGDKLDQYNFVLDYVNDYLTNPVKLIELDGAIEIIQNLGSKVNLAFLEVEKKKSKIGVEQIEVLINFASQKPHLNEISVAIIDEAEKLGLEAQNKLLKLLEEPPAYLQIFLLCAPDSNSIESIITTVKSRCQTIQLKSETEQGRGEGNSEIPQIASLLMGTEQDIKQGYQKLRGLLDKEKDNQTAKSHLKKLITEISKINSDQFDASNTSHAESIQKLVNEVNSAIKANVNSRLIIDKIFLSLHKW